MKNISEYDERQLRLMRANLVAFEKKQIALVSLVGSLDFLLSALESSDKEWGERVLEEVTILEVANAVEMIKDSGESILDIESKKQEMLISKSVANLKKLVESRLIQ